MTTSNKNQQLTAVGLAQLGARSRRHPISTFSFFSEHDPKILGLPREVRWQICHRLGGATGG